MRLTWLAILALTLAGCSGNSSKQEKAEEPKAPAPAPERFHAKFSTTKGDFVIETVREWAPRGADRFYQLLQEKYYDGARFFRVRPKFIVQFGLNPDPKVTELWRQLRIPDDAVTQRNERGYVTFAMAGPGSRTTQLFINLADNSSLLDGQGFAPFGRVLQGMAVVDQFYAGYGEVQQLGGGGPDSTRIEAQGEEYLERAYPLLDKINTAVILPNEPTGR